MSQHPTLHLNPSTCSVVGQFSLTGALTQPGQSPQPHSKFPAETAWHPSSLACRSAHEGSASAAGTARLPRAAPAGTSPQDLLPSCGRFQHLFHHQPLVFHPIPWSGGSKPRGPSSHSRRGPPEGCAGARAHLDGFFRPCPRGCRLNGFFLLSGLLLTLSIL